ncbi:GTP pyrophosphokinase [Intrasporangium oryzae NRRL B-24470]|uniref:GTP pyrophosphokinase n=1 Tax=Intrasporangium oryzae NRRL B-24470 TaxID=1386089 RepID=W9GHB7_9MICO|nr:GTP pyrophosphokinase [Intrasporangium oryzae]EWT03284.1 GTP pyrophosphokinase [Intrasporangium oryzae NRRL B-24470]
MSTPPLQPPEPIRAAVRAYAERQPTLRASTALFVELITSLLDDAGINYLSVTGRTKSVESFAAKAERTRDGELLYRKPLEEITDQIGVRVITYVHDDVAAVADLLAEELAVLDDRDLGEETAREGRFGYASRHLLVAVDASRTVPSAYESLRRLSASVQVRTVLQHAWAEFEHDIRYKGSVPKEHARDLDRRFTLAAGLLELADREFSAIRDRLNAGVPDRPVAGSGTGSGTGPVSGASSGSATATEIPADPRLDAQELAKFLAAAYPDAGWSRTDHYTWISGLLLELGITSLDELGTIVAQVDPGEVLAAMGYKYPPGAVRRLDDTLLAIYGETYLGLHGNRHREASLQARLEKVRGAA